MQTSHLDTKGKSKILFLFAIVLGVITIPLSISHFIEGHGIHIGIHIISIILGSFLSVVSAMTYLEYRTKRLFFILGAFSAITIAEIVSTANFLLFFQESYIDTDSLLTHGLILLMLSLFSLGIFRAD
jgi:hypothetical protein